MIYYLPWLRKSTTLLVSGCGFAIIMLFFFLVPKEDLQQPGNQPITTGGGQKETSADSFPERP